MSSNDMNSTAISIGSGNLSQNGTTVSTPGTLGVFAHWDFLIITAQITLSAMGIIWFGSHTSLRRPPSAARAATPAGREGKNADKEERAIDGLVASDAIMFPLLAGTVLIGLYYLIKWLQDPDILNRILRAYMSFTSLASLSKLSADALHLLTTIVFPNVWSDCSGRLWIIDSLRQQQVLRRRGRSADSPVIDRRTPFPGPLSGASFSGKTNKAFWGLRHLLMEEWTVRMSLHGIGAGKVKIKLNDMFGILLATSITLTYYWTSWSWLSNIVGTGFSYFALTLLSPTSFAVGTMVLAGLFVYDIVMVFYTPYMITVATKLDVPIKLVFGAPGRSSMLGLGDIVIPGIFIGLALRFDLWRYYQEKIVYVPTELQSEVKDEKSENAVTVTETQYRALKTPYIDPKGQWGDRLWTTTLRNTFFMRPPVTTALAATAFPKTYFYSAMIGYALGMLLTLIMLLVFRHGQPALLYLVPCVTGAVWLTGVIRGELHDMWTYTEDGSLDTQDVVVELDGNGKVIKEISDKKAAEDDGKDSDSPCAESSAGSRNSTLIEKEEDHEKATNPRPSQGYDVFLFSITAPPQESHKEE